MIHLKINFDDMDHQSALHAFDDREGNLYVDFKTPTWLFDYFAICFYVGKINYTTWFNLKTSEEKYDYLYTILEGVGCGCLKIKNKYIVLPKWLSEIIWS